MSSHETLHTRRTLIKKGIVAALSATGILASNSNLRSSREILKYSDFENEQEKIRAQAANFPRLQIRNIPTINPDIKMPYSQPQDAHQHETLEGYGIDNIAFARSPNLSLLILDLNLTSEAALGYPYRFRKSPQIAVVFSLNREDMAQSLAHKIGFDSDGKKINRLRVIFNLNVALLDPEDELAIHLNRGVITKPNGMLPDLTLPYRFSFETPSSPNKPIQGPFNV